MTVHSYVAVGDSFSEGLDDPYPDGSGYRGWTDLVAAALAARAPGLRYANLAVRGRLLGPIVAEQVPVAAGLGADLVSVAGGGNDLLRRRYDSDVSARLLDTAVARLVDSGARVLMVAGADVSRRMPGASRLRPRIEALNGAARRVAAARGALLVEIDADPAFDDPRLWSADRLHLNPAGHRRVAAAALAALDVPAEESWRAPLPAAAPVPWAQARAQDVQWLRRDVAPWMRRRLTGRSSGDTVTAKRPELEPIR